MKSTQVQAAMETEQIDSLAPARGIFNGCLFALAFYLLAAACVIGGLLMAGLVKW